MKILVVEDEKELADSMLSYLKGEGYVCEIALNYQTGLEKISLYKYDCVVVDLNLPDGNGLNLIKKLKENNYDGGIIISSARNSLTDRIDGLNIGADDYLIKPFHLAELNARIKSLIRRVNFQGSNSIIFNEIEIKLDEHVVFVNSEMLDLTKKEYYLLLFLVSNKNRVLSKEAIAEHLWGDYIDSADSFDFVYTHIKNLRKKLIDKKAGDYIQNVYGVGYKFVVN